METRFASNRQVGFIAATCFVFCVAIFTAFVARPLENLVRDLMMSTISPFTSPPTDIVVVVINEETLAQFPYRSPIDRSFVARVVAKLAAAGPRAIGIDLLFDQPTEHEKDAALQQAIAQAGVPVVVGSASSTDLSANQLAFLNGFAPSARRGLAVLSRDRLDGVIRHTFAGRETDNKWEPGFAGAVAEAGGLSSPNKKGTMVYYRGSNAEPFKFPVYPAQLALLAPPKWFAGKFVLLGVDLPLEDRHPTPFTSVNGVINGSLPGVIIHAHALAQMVSGDRVLTTGPPAGILLFLFAGSLCAWLAWRPMPVMFKPFAILFVLAIIWAAAAYVFAWKAIQVPLVAPTFSVIGLATLIAFLAWRRDQRDKQFVLRAFSQYVSPTVVDEIVKHPEALRLGGERRQITCVFTDLEGFTQFSERLTPEALASVLNNYLDELCDLFIDHGATIDKVIGDAVVGFFGAPAKQEDQAERAVALTLAIGVQSQRMRAKLLAEGLTLGVTRVGVHSGPAIVGNFGGKRFFDYTAIGDTVNTAARLEGANKYIGTSNCISGAVMQQNSLHLFRPSGVLFLKGKNEGIETFEALEDSAPNRAMAGEYLKAYGALARDDRRAAARIFASLATGYPDDPLIAYHRNRLTNGMTGVSIHLTDK